LERVEARCENPTTFTPEKHRKTPDAIEPPKSPNPITVICFKSFKFKTL
jgi:hypothetical protein